MEPKYNFTAAVVGGDLRQVEVAGALTELFKEVRIYGHPSSVLPAAVVFGAHLDELVHARAIILPINGMNESGMVTGYKPEQTINFGSFMPSLTKGTSVITGSITAQWLQKANHLQLKVFQYADNDEIAILNSIPTAEGALQIAMEQLPITIHGSRVLIIGFGRVGETVAHLFKAVGAKTVVAARRASSLARALEQGHEKAGINSLPDIIERFDLIINTVPVPIINETLLAKVASGSLMIELASPPYGIDFEAVRKLNIKAILAPGLPGKVAPKTAGRILSSTIPGLIRDWFDGGEQ